MIVESCKLKFVLNFGFQACSIDTQIIRIVKFFIVTNTTDFFLSPSFSEVWEGGI